MGILITTLLTISGIAGAAAALLLTRWDGRTNDQRIGPLLTVFALTGTLGCVLLLSVYLIERMSEIS